MTRETNMIFADEVEAGMVHVDECHFLHRDDPDMWLMHQDGTRHEHVYKFERVRREDNGVVAIVRDELGRQQSWYRQRNTCVRIMEVAQ